MNAHGHCGRTKKRMPQALKIMALDNTFAESMSARAIDRMMKMSWFLAARFRRQDSMPRRVFAAAFAFHLAMCRRCWARQRICAARRAADCVPGAESLAKISRRAVEGVLVLSRQDSRCIGSAAVSDRAGMTSDMVAPENGRLRSAHAGRPAMTGNLWARRSRGIHRRFPGLGGCRGARRPGDRGVGVARATASGSGRCRPRPPGQAGPRRVRHGYPQNLCQSKRDHLRWRCIHRRLRGVLGLFTYLAAFEC